MKKFKYTPTPMFYALTGSILVTLIISPPICILVCGAWFLYAFIVFANKCSK